MARGPVGGVALVLVLASCGGRAEDVCAACPAAVTLRFRPDPGAVGSEAYLCFGFDAAQVAKRAIVQLAATLPERSGVTLHHLALFAVAGDYPDGPTPCYDMPAGAVELHVAGPTSAPLMLPAGVGIDLPPSTALRHDRA